MSNVHVQAELTSDELMRAIERLNKRDFNRVFEQILMLNARRKAPVLSKKESDLFDIINKGLSPDQQARLDYLVERRESDQLAPAEDAELLEMIEAIEESDARRISAVSELATLRNMSFDDLWSTLGLKR